MNQSSKYSTFWLTKGWIIGLIVAVAIFVGSFFVPLPALTPASSSTTPSGAITTDVNVHLMESEQVVVYSADKNSKCTYSREAGIKGSLTVPFLISSRSINSSTLYPIGEKSGATTGVDYHIHCDSMQPIYTSKAWIINETNILLLRALAFVCAIIAIITIRSDYS